MFITLTNDVVEFNYGSKRWKYHFSEIVELGLVKSKKTFLLLDTALVSATAAGYYYAVNSDFLESYYIAPATLFYVLLLTKRFYNVEEFQYHVILRDIYDKTKTVKIKNEDRNAMGKQIDSYLELNYVRLTRKSNDASCATDLCS